MASWKVVDWIVPVFCYENTGAFRHEKDFFGAINIAYFGNFVKYI